MMWTQFDGGGFGRKRSKVGRHWAGMTRENTVAAISLKDLLDIAMFLSSCIVIETTGCCCCCCPFAVTVENRNLSTQNDDQFQAHKLLAFVLESSFAGSF